MLDLGYNYNRGNSKGSLNGTTGQLTNIVNNLDRNKDRVYEFDTLGRLTTAKGGIAAGATGVTANWTQNYAFDRYGNRTSVTAAGITANSQAVPTDGLASLGYQTTTNRINTSGYEYDLAGSQTRGQSPTGSWQRFEYDAAGRLVKIKDDAGTVLESHTYGASRQRLINETSTQRTYYAWGGSSVLCEYVENSASPTSPVFTKSYIYAGSRLLSTQTWNGTAEITEFHHPERLGTKLVTNNSANTSFEQATLPFGTSLDAETSGITNQRFTSYDRSTVANLDYAQNRSYSSGQGRFTSVDPIGMSSGSASNPQSNNLYAYVGNNPIDYTDPSGLKMVCDYELYRYETDVKIIDDDSKPNSDNSGSSGWGWRLVCHEESDIEKPIISDPPPNHGGGPISEPPPTKSRSTDPCAGNKGALDFSKNWANHIFPRHVATQNPKWFGKSKYIFFLTEWTEAQYQSSVSSTGQTTFENGVYADGGNGTSVYTYAFPGIDLGDQLWIMDPVGYDGKSGAMTNVNTVVVGSDCTTVISAYPGLPRQFNDYDIPGAQFKTNGYTLKHKAYNF